jgi:hypothetical protein
VSHDDRIRRGQDESSASNSLELVCGLVALLVVPGPGRVELLERLQKTSHTQNGIDCSRCVSAIRSAVRSRTWLRCSLSDFIIFSQIKHRRFRLSRGYLREPEFMFRTFEMRGVHSRLREGCPKKRLPCPLARRRHFGAQVFVHCQFPGDRKAAPVNNLPGWVLPHLQSF